MFDEWLEMCEWQYRWRFVKQMTQLQTKSFSSQYIAWLLKEKRLKQKPSNKMTDFDLHQGLNTVHFTELHISLC